MVVGNQLTLVRFKCNITETVIPLCRATSKTAFPLSLSPWRSKRKVYRLRSEPDLISALWAGALPTNNMDGELCHFIDWCPMTWWFTLVVKIKFQQRPQILWGHHAPWTRSLFEFYVHMQRLKWRQGYPNYWDTLSDDIPPLILSPAV